MARPELRLLRVARALPLPPVDEVHVWALDLARPPLAAADLLPSVDLHRAERLKGDKGHWVAARAGLRALLGGYLDADPATLALEESAKPRLHPPSPLRFNVAHSGDVALVAVASEREVGVDVERIRRDRTVDIERLARRILLANERAAVLEADDTEEAFIRHWVAKEAFVKATGRGIASLRSFELSLDGPEGPRIVHVANDEREARRWRLHMLDVASPYAAALVTEGDARVAPLAVFEP